MSDSYMKQLERINAKMKQLRENPERRMTSARWKHNFLNSIQAIKQGKERVSVASGGSGSTMKLVKTTGLIDAICNIARRVDDDHCNGKNAGGITCNAMHVLQATLGCDDTIASQDGGACRLDSGCQSG